MLTPAWRGPISAYQDACSALAAHVASHGDARIPGLKWNLHKSGILGRLRFPDGQCMLPWTEFFFSIGNLGCGPIHAAILQILKNVTEETGWNLPSEGHPQGCLIAASGTRRS